jgi:hypothetical protein
VAKVVMTYEQAHEWLIAYWQLTPKAAKSMSYEGSLRTTSKMLVVFVNDLVRRTSSLRGALTCSEAEVTDFKSVNPVETAASSSSSQVLQNDGSQDPLNYDPPLATVEDGSGHRQRDGSDVWGGPACEVIAPYPEPPCRHKVINKERRHE